MEENNQNQIEIDLPQDVMNGVYSNFAIISHSPMEFVVDFVQLLPNTPKASVRSRVVMTPVNAKNFLKAMQDNMKKFEDVFGRIKETETPPIYPNNFAGGGPPKSA